MEAERKKVTNHSPLLTNYINTNYQSSLFGKRSEQFNCGGLTAVFLCSHQWHNCKSSEGETLPQAASGLQWIKKNIYFHLRGLRSGTHVSSAPKHRSLTSLNLQLFTCGHKGMNIGIWGGEGTSIQVRRVQHILTVNQSLLSLWTR